MSETRRPSSGMHRLGLADCPRCHGSKRIVPAAAPCDFCVVDGEPTGKVTLAKAGEFFGLEPATRRDTPSSIAALRPDTLPPDTEPDPERKNDE